MEPVYRYVDWFLVWVVKGKGFWESVCVCVAEAELITGFQLFQSGLPHHLRKQLCLEWLEDSSSKVELRTKAP